MSEQRREPVEESTTVRFVCDACGRVHHRNTPPCNDCGAMSLVAVEDAVDENRQIDADGSWALAREATGGVTGVRIFVSLVGVVTLAFAALNLGVGLWLGAPPATVYGAFLLAAGVVATPALRRRLERRASLRPSVTTLVVGYLVLVVVGRVVEAAMTGLLWSLL